MADAGLFIEVSRARLLATADGALYLPKEETLVVSDLHFEKGSAFAARGVLLPPYDTRVTLKRLAALVTKLKPLQVISLGDAFHDGEAEARMEEEDAAADRDGTVAQDASRPRDAALEGLVAFARWTWVLGNHDPAPPKRFGGEVAMTKRIGRLIFRHEPAKKAADGEIAGHLHPCARIRTETRIQRRRCFASDGKRLVMPAFGAYAGGLNVLDAAFADILPAPFVFALGRARVYPIAPALLVADPPSAAMPVGSLRRSRREHSGALVFALTLRRGREAMANQRLARPLVSPRASAAHQLCAGVRIGGDAEPFEGHFAGIAATELDAALTDFDGKFQRAAVIHGNAPAMPVEDGEIGASEHVAAPAR